MPRFSIPLLAALGALAISAPGCQRADAYESFTLGPKDLIIAETRGCSAECRITTPTQRTCTLRDFGCRAVCTPIPECRPDGISAIKVCAVVKDTP